MYVAALRLKLPDGREVTVRERGTNHEALEFYCSDGNMACDCNRSTLVREQADPLFPQLECGDSLELLDLTITGQE